MCDLGHAHDHQHFGFLVDTSEIRALIDETRRLTTAIPDTAARVDALRPAFGALLALDGWLPESCAKPDDVRTISDTPSISIHLLANDTACVWRHKFEPLTGIVTPFRSGYANAPCPAENQYPCLGGV